MPISIVFFFVSIASIFLSEVLVNYNRVELSLFLVLLSPFFLFLLAKIEKRKIEIPIYETIAYFIFLIFSIVSTIYAIDKEIAIKSLLIYASGYLFFVFIFNYNKEINKYFRYFLISISVFSCSIFLINNIFHLDLFKKDISLFYNYGHYQVGNLLVLGVISAFPNILSLIFFVFILFSYSRTAHISLIVSFIILLFKDKLNKKTVLLGALIIFISLIFIVLKTNYLQQTGRQWISGRNIYFSYATSSIKEFPLFGTGPGNFAYAVFKRQVNYGMFTDSAENFILEIFAENGILAGTFFILFVLIVFHKHKKNSDFLTFLALTLMFMIDFSYRFNSFLILWFILGGLVLNTEKKKFINILPYVVIVFVAAQMILLSQILLKYGLWEQSLLINPIQKNAYVATIAKSIKEKDKKQTYYFLQKYDQTFGRSTVIFKEIFFYQALGDKNKVALLYERSLWFRTFTSMNNMRQMLINYTNLYGYIKGSEKMSDMLIQIKNNYSEKDKTSDFYKEIDNFCKKTSIGC